MWLDVDCWSSSFSNAYAVILSERTTGSEATRWSSSFQVRRLWMQDRAARLGTMGQAAILPPDLGCFLSFSFFRTNERTNELFLSSPRPGAWPPSTGSLWSLAKTLSHRGSYQLQSPASGRWKRSARGVWYGDESAWVVWGSWLLGCEGNICGSGSVDASARRAGRLPEHPASLSQ